MIFRVFLLMVLAGCERGSAPVGQSSDVVATAGEHQLKADEVSRRGDNIVLLWRNQQSSKKPSEADLEKLKAHFVVGYPKVWAEDRVLEDYFAQARLEIPETVISNMQMNAFRRFRAKGERNYADFSGREGLDRALWEDQVRADARRVVAADHWVETEPEELPADYAERVIAEMRAWNVAMAQTNDVQWAKATNVWNQIKAGGDFAAIGKASTENPEEAEDDCEWACIDSRFLEDEPVLKSALAQMKVGDVSPPLAADNGIMIVRLDSLAEDEGYNVSRIYFRLARILNPAPPDEIRAHRARAYRDELFQRKLKELVESARVTFKQQ